MPKLHDIVSYADNYLKITEFSDYCPNGLQVEGQQEIHKIASGVSASMDFIEAASAWGAQCLLVHHGYFWKNEPSPITGMKKKRISRLLKQDLSLLAYHLPLDAHPVVGNNIQLAEKLGIQPIGPLQKTARMPIGTVGNLAEPTSALDFVAHCESVLNRNAVHINAGPEQIQRIAWCTGGAQHMIEDAVAQGADLYLSGEISEQTTHVARECKIHYVGAGHHATERYGAQALGRHLAEKFEIEHQFFDIDNPA